MPSICDAPVAYVPIISPPPSRGVTAVLLLALHVRLMHNSANIVFQEHFLEQDCKWNDLIICSSNCDLIWTTLFSTSRVCVSNGNTIARTGCPDPDAIVLIVFLRINERRRRKQWSAAKLRPHFVIEIRAQRPPPRAILRHSTQFSAGRNNADSCESAQKTMATRRTEKANQTKIKPA